LLTLFAVEERLVLAIVHQEFGHCYLFLNTVLANALHELIDCYLVEVVIVVEMELTITLVHYLLHLLLVEEVFIILASIYLIKVLIIVHNAIYLLLVDRQVQLLTQVKKLSIICLICLSCLHLIQVICELVRCRCHEPIAIWVILAEINSSTRPVYWLSVVIVCQLTIILLILLFINWLVKLIYLCSNCLIIWVGGYHPCFF